MPPAPLGAVDARGSTAISTRVPVPAGVVSTQPHRQESSRLAGAPLGQYDQASSTRYQLKTFGLLYPVGSAPTARA